MPLIKPRLQIRKNIKILRTIDQKRIIDKSYQTDIPFFKDIKKKLYLRSTSHFPDGILLVFCTQVRLEDITKKWGTSYFWLESTVLGIIYILRQ